MEYDLVEMLSYMRPEGSKTQKTFCDRYLKPVMGEPDLKGNYTLTIGDKPNIAFMAHHDTVHTRVGLQEVYEYKGEAFSFTDCLGADCTTGVWLILNMIKAKVPGVYVVHADEEQGCGGSRYIVDQHPDWIDHVDAAISFDRRGIDSIVTHQLGFRTCSDAFAISLNDAIGMSMKPDATGAYTDSNEYSHLIQECTNISVGYYDQHTDQESQDLLFAEQLLQNLINADWESLVYDRDLIEESYEEDGLYRLVYEHPDSVTEMLIAFGFSEADLQEFIYEKRGYIG